VSHRDPRAQRAFQPPLRCPLRIGRDGNIDLVDHRIDLGGAFPQRLSGLARDQVGKFVLFAPHDIGEAAQCLDPHRQRPRRPGRPGAPRARYLGIDVAAGPGPQGRAGRRLV
jgi:hypothetical protein